MGKIVKLVIAQTEEVAERLQRKYPNDLIGCQFKAKPENHIWQEAIELFGCKIVYTQCIPTGTVNFKEA